MIIAIPVDADDQVAHGWGRAPAIALATVTDGQITDWQVHDVRWDVAHDEGTEGSHHARIARFLREHGIEAIAVDHVGAGMHRMLPSMGVRIADGLVGDARDAARAAAA